MPAVLSDDIRKQIIEIYSHQKISNFFAFAHIPPKKLSNAIKSYAPSLDGGEVIVFLYDDTVFGSSKEGFILTSARLYYKNIVASGFFTDISNINDITINQGKLSADIMIHTNTDTLELQITQAQGQEQVALLNALDKTIKILKGTSPGTGQASAPSSPVCRGCGATGALSDIRCEYCGSSLR